jgi:hypothetical protein
VSFYRTRLPQQGSTESGFLFGTLVTSEPWTLFVYFFLFFFSFKSFEF